VLLSLLMGAGLAYMLCEQIADAYDREVETLRFKIVAHLCDGPLPAQALQARVAPNHPLGGADSIRAQLRALHERGIVRQRGEAWELTGVLYDGD